LTEQVDLALRQTCIEPFEPRAEEKVVHYVTAALAGEARAFPWPRLSGGQGVDFDCRF